MKTRFRWSSISTWNASTRLAIKFLSWSCLDDGGIGALAGLLVIMLTALSTSLSLGTSAASAFGSSVGSSSAFGASAFGSFAVGAVLSVSASFCVLDSLGDCDWSPAWVDGCAVCLDGPATGSVTSTTVLAKVRAETFRAESVPAPTAASALAACSALVKLATLPSETLSFWRRIGASSSCGALRRIARACCEFLTSVCVVVRSTVIAATWAW